MILDFTNCKTAKDVREILKKNERFLKMMKKFKELKPRKENKVSKIKKLDKENWGYQDAGLVVALIAIFKKINEIINKLNQLETKKGGKND